MKPSQHRREIVRRTMGSRRGMSSQNIFDSIFQDIRFGARILLKSPGVTAAVIIALALGIGANAAIFSVVDTLILHSLHYEDPSSLAVIWDQDPQGGLRFASAGDFLDWRRE